MEKCIFEIQSHGSKHVFMESFRSLHFNPPKNTTSLRNHKILSGPSCQLFHWLQRKKGPMIRNLPQECHPYLLCPRLIG